MSGLEMLAQLAAAKAALDLGLVRQLWEAPGTAADLAVRTGCERRALERVLDVLVTMGVASRDDGVVGRDVGVYRLGAALRADLAQYPGGFDRSLALFEHVARFARTGEPVAAMDGSDHQRAAAYRDLVGGLAAMWEAGATVLAEALGPMTGTIVDLGAGSGVWSLALAARSPDVRVVAVDFPPVLAQFSERAGRLGLGERVSMIGGSWWDVTLPACEVIVLANVLHLEDPANARRMLSRAAEVAPRILIVDVLDGPDLDAQRRHAAYSLHLAARTRSGTAHRRAELARWLADLGYAIDRHVPALTETTLLTCLDASRRPR